MPREAELTFDVWSISTKYSGKVCCVKTTVEGTCFKDALSKASLLRKYHAGAKPDATVKITEVFVIPNKNKDEVSEFFLNEERK